MNKKGYVKRTYKGKPIYLPILNEGVFRRMVDAFSHYDERKIIPPDSIMKGEWFLLGSFMTIDADWQDSKYITDERFELLLKHKIASLNKNEILAMSLMDL